MVHSIEAFWDDSLFFGEDTRMLFGDAKESLSRIIGKFKA